MNGKQNKTKPRYIHMDKKSSIDLFAREREVIIHNAVLVTESHYCCHTPVSNWFCDQFDCGSRHLQLDPGDSELRCNPSPVNSEVE